MAANEWINGYLEAILADGAPVQEQLDDAESPAPIPSPLKKGDFSPAKYFVDEVVTATDEASLHRTWLLVYSLCSSAFTDPSPSDPPLVFSISFVFWYILR
jgi:hypothetical protein